LLVEEFSIKKKWKNDYLIIVFGSTGTGTMTFASDVDLIFVMRDSGKYQNIQKDFQILLGNLKKELSPFSVDCRLRPEGASSQLVWDFNKYTEYLDNRARVWELQSFLKARFVSGNEKLFTKLTESFQKRLSGLNETEVLNGVNEMVSKSQSFFPAELNLIDLKKNPGGLNDIESVVHYFLLSNPKKVLSVVGKANPRILKEHITDSRNKKVLNELADNYIFIKNLEIFNQIVFNVSSSKLSLDENRLDKLSHLITTKTGEELKTKLNSVLKFNRESYTKLMLKK